MNEREWEQLYIDIKTRLQHASADLNDARYVEEIKQLLQDKPFQIAMMILIKLVNNEVGITHDDPKFVAGLAAIVLFVEESLESIRSQMALAAAVGD